MKNLIMISPDPYQATEDVCISFDLDAEASEGLHFAFSEMLTQNGIQFCDFSFPSGAHTIVCEPFGTEVVVDIANVFWAMLAAKQ